MKSILYLVLLGLLAMPVLAENPYPNLPRNPNYVGSPAGHGLFGDVNGYLQLQSEADTTGQDLTVYKSEFSVWKDVPAGNVVLEPYYYFRNDSNFSQGSSPLLTENQLGVDLLVQQNQMLDVAVGIGYKTRYLGYIDTRDQLFTSRFRLDF